MTLSIPEGQLSLAAICEEFAREEAALRARARALGLSRREFLQALVAGAAATALAPALGSVARAAASAPEGPLPPKSRVVIVTHPEVIIKEYKVNPPIVKQMVDRAVVELTGAKTEAAAWQKIGREDDFVAIKHNTMDFPTLHSHTEINDAVSAQLAAAAKVKAESILVVDRKIPAPYNELSDPFTLPSNKLETRLRRLYTEKATAIVNVSVLKAHFGEGLLAALKNHLGSVNNPSEYHFWQPGRMPRNLAELNALAPIRTKTRLCIVDAIRPLFAGGPADEEPYRWDYRGLIVGTDPVAVSAVGMRILEAKREASLGKPWPMTAAREMLAFAQKIGLGAADPDRIDLVEAKMG
jgi:uncharacterized protein (DUF362 family)